MNDLDARVSATYIPWGLLGGLLLVSLVLGILYIATPAELRFFDHFIDVCSVVYSLFLTLLCFKGSPRLLRKPASPVAGERDKRRFIPALLGMGALCLALGQLVRVYGTMSTRQEPTYPALNHFISLGMYPCFIAAFLLLPSQNLSPLSRLRILFDSLIIITTVTTLYCYFILVPIFAATAGTIQEEIVGSLFTLADLALLFCLLLVALRSEEVVLQRVIVLLGLAILVIFVGHVVYLSALLSDEYTVTIRTNASWLFGLALITVAAQMMSRVLSKGQFVERGSTVLLEETGLPATTRWRTILGYVPVLVFGLLVLSLWMQQENHHTLARWAVVDVGGTINLILLALRQLLAMHEVTILKQELRAKNRSLNTLNAQLEELATLDPLTSLPNHRTLIDRLDGELARAREEQTTCSVIFMDLDYFKSINDKYGHLVGDQVLCQFAVLVRSLLNPEDCLGRWGGEEFVAILPGKDPPEALALAEQIRTRVAKQTFASEEDLYVTCSLGLATYPHTVEERERLLVRADRAMYVAKRLGRNQIRTADEPEVLAYEPCT